MSIGEHIARVEVVRLDERYGVVITFADGTVREVGGGEWWSTLSGALERTSVIIAAELHRRRMADDPRGSVP